MSDHSAGYMLNDFIAKIGERGIIDFDRRPEAVGMLVRLANDLVEWEMSHGNPRRGYVQDANCYEIAGNLPHRHHFCRYCGHGSAGIAGTGWMRHWSMITGPAANVTSSRPILGGTRADRRQVSTVNFLV